MSEKTSYLDRIKKLDAEMAELRQSAKAEALAKAQEGVRELEELGFMYDLIEREEDGGQAGKGRGTGVKRPMSDKPCSICGFKTLPLHDARAHRSQETKKPFTAAELKARDLERA